MQHLLEEFKPELLTDDDVTAEEMHAYWLACSHEFTDDRLDFIWFALALKACREDCMPTFEHIPEMMGFFQHNGDTCLTSTMDTLVGIHHTILVSGLCSSAIISLLHNVRQRVYYLATHRLPRSILNNPEYTLRKKTTLKSGFTKAELCSLKDMEDFPEIYLQPEPESTSEDDETDVIMAFVSDACSYLLDIDKGLKRFRELEDMVDFMEEQGMQPFREYLLSIAMTSHEDTVVNIIVNWFYSIQVRPADKRVYQRRHPDRGGEPTPTMLMCTKHSELMDMRLTELDKIKELIRSDQDKAMQKIITDACFKYAGKNRAFQFNYVNVFEEALKYIWYEPTLCSWCFRLAGRIIACDSLSFAFVESRKYGLGLNYLDKYINPTLPLA